MVGRHPSRMLLSRCDCIFGSSMDQHGPDMKDDRGILATDVFGKLSSL